jgi:hypothetical protein
MRERAEGTTNAEWWPYFCPESKGSTEGDWIVDSAPTFICSTQSDTDRGKADAHHIASWHPAVALAMAAALDQHAPGHDGLAILHGRAIVCPHADCDLLRAARTYLGEEAAS